MIPRKQHEEVISIEIEAAIHDKAKFLAEAQGVSISEFFEQMVRRQAETLPTGDTLGTSNGSRSTSE